MVKFALHHTPVLNRTEIIDMLKDKSPILGHMDVLCYADVTAWLSCQDWLNIFIFVEMLTLHSTETHQASSCAPSCHSIYFFFQQYVPLELDKP